MRKVFWLVALLAGLSAIVSSSCVSALGAGDTGLTISPLRQEAAVVPGKVSSGNFTVTNPGDEPIIVDLTVRQFSVADYTYEYSFREPENDWVKLKDKSITLGPKKSQKVWYDIQTPERAKPGGYYYALFASTTTHGEGLPGTVQAASLLYVSAQGKLIRTSVLKNDSIPLFVTGDEITYKFDVKNTGNVHFSAYFYGQVQGLFGTYPEVGTSHLLMPDSVRQINGGVPTPLLPGVYKVTYGYKVDFADIITSKTAFVVYVPPWSIAILILLVIIARRLWRRRSKASK